MVWEKNTKYTNTDYWEWKRSGYRGMKLIKGIPYQYGTSVFEQQPERFPPATINSILANFLRQLSVSLKDMPHQIYRSYPIVICREGEKETPDIVVMKHDEKAILVVDIAESEKQERLSLCRETGIPCWWLYPESQSIIVHMANDIKVYGNDDEIPIAETAACFV